MSSDAPPRKKLTRSRGHTLPPSPSPPSSPSEGEDEELGFSYDVTTGTMGPSDPPPLEGGEAPVFLTQLATIDEGGESEEEQSSDGGDMAPLIGPAGDTEQPGADAESSHWMFSVDTNTDSVILLPQTPRDGTRVSGTECGSLEPCELLETISSNNINISSNEAAASTPNNTNRSSTNDSNSSASEEEEADVALVFRSTATSRPFSDDHWPATHQRHLRQGVQRQTPPQTDPQLDEEMLQQEQSLLQPRGYDVLPRQEDVPKPHPPQPVLKDLGLPTGGAVSRVDAFGLPTSWGTQPSDPHPRGNQPSDPPPRGNQPPEPPTRGYRPRPLSIDMAHQFVSEEVVSSPSTLDPASSNDQSFSRSCSESSEPSSDPSLVDSRDNLTISKSSFSRSSSEDASDAAHSPRQRPDSNPATIPSSPKGDKDPLCALTDAQIQTQIDRHLGLTTHRQMDRISKLKAELQARKQLEANVVTESSLHCVEKTSFLSLKKCDTTLGHNAEIRSTSDPFNYLTDDNFNEFETQKSINNNVGKYRQLPLSLSQNNKLNIRDDKILINEEPLWSDQRASLTSLDNNNKPENWLPVGVTSQLRSNRDWSGAGRGAPHAGSAQCGSSFGRGRVLNHSLRDYSNRESQFLATDNTQSQELAFTASVSNRGSCFSFGDRGEGQYDLVIPEGSGGYESKDNPATVQLRRVGKGLGVTLPEPGCDSPCARDTKECANDNSDCDARGNSINNTSEKPSICAGDFSERYSEARPNTWIMKGKVDIRVSGGLVHKEALRGDGDGQDTLSNSRNLNNLIKKYDSVDALENINAYKGTSDVTAVNGRCNSAGMGVTGGAYVRPTPQGAPAGTNSQPPWLRFLRNSGRGSKNSRVASTSLDATTNGKPRIPPKPPALLRPGYLPAAPSADELQEAGSAATLPPSALVPQVDVPAGGINANSSRKHFSSCDNVALVPLQPSSSAQRASLWRKWRREASALLGRGGHSKGGNGDLRPPAPSGNSKGGSGDLRPLPPSGPISSYPVYCVGADKYDDSSRHPSPNGILLRGTDDTLTNGDRDQGVPATTNGAHAPRHRPPLPRTAGSSVPAIFRRKPTTTSTASCRAGSDERRIDWSGDHHHHHHPITTTGAAAAASGSVVAGGTTSGAAVSGVRDGDVVRCAGGQDKDTTPSTEGVVVQCNSEVGELKFDGNCRKYETQNLSTTANCRSRRAELTPQRINCTRVRPESPELRSKPLEERSQCDPLIETDIDTGASRDLLHRIGCSDRAPFSRNSALSKTISYTHRTGGRNDKISYNNCNTFRGNTLNCGERSVSECTNNISGVSDGVNLACGIPDCDSRSVSDTQLGVDRRHDRRTTSYLSRYSTDDDGRVEPCTDLDDLQKDLNSLLTAIQAKYSSSSGEQCDFVRSRSAVYPSRTDTAESPKLNGRLSHTESDGQGHSLEYGQSSMSSDQYAQSEHNYGQCEEDKGSDGGLSRARSLVAVHTMCSSNGRAAGARPDRTDERTRSLEHLLDTDDMAVPENSLRKAAGSGRTPSEAELRVRRSLKNLNLPDWMKGATTPSQGFILRRGSSTDPASTPPWAASSKPWDRGSSSSIAAGSSGGAAGVSNQLSRYASSRSYTLPSPSSATSPSPSAGPTGSGVFHYPSSTVQYPLSRWSLSKISTTGGDQQQGASGSTTPTGSVFSQRSTASYGGRSQPYLGWRSQTSLHIQESSSGTVPTAASKYLSAAERLALSVSPHKILSKSTSVEPQVIKSGSSGVVTAGPPPLSSRPLPHPPPTTRQPTSTHSNGIQPTTRQPTSATHPTSNTASAGSHEDINNTSGSMGCDIHSSIREVTSAIVHYCSERAPSNPPSAGGTRLLPSPASSGSSRPKSPGRRPQLWLESSFVGSRPIDNSPETPGLPPIGSPLAPSMPPPPPPATTPPEPTAASPLLAAAGECSDDTPAREASR